MAAFDLVHQRMCVRVVFDGAAGAGKTTNLRQLAEIFATQRTCELFSPAELDGRTLYFDWLQLAAGMVCGFPLLCQVISVPGQLVLTPRRRHLLTTADAVVHVCESDEGSLGRARAGLELVDEVSRARGEPLPLVIQANKQDRPRAMSGAAVLAAFGRPGLPVVEAIAAEGIGVVDTFVSAVRAVVRSIQARIEVGAFRVAVRSAESAAGLLGRLSSEAIDPEWELEMLLEQASNAFVLAGSLNDEALAQGAANDEPPPTWRPTPAAWRTPPLPVDTVPTGFIWPAHTGRAALQALAAEPAMNAPVHLDADGAARVVAGDVVLSTSIDQRFDAPEAARQALVRGARERTQLASLLPPETVLVAQPADDAVTWLWTLLPSLPSVADLLAAGDGRRGGEGALLTAFGAALGDALRVEATCGCLLDLSPGAFGLRHGVVRYIGSVPDGRSRYGEPVRSAASALLASLEALAALTDDIEPALVSLESGLASKLTLDERGALARLLTWPDLASVPPVLRAFPARVDEVLRRGQRAA